MLAVARLIAPYVEEKEDCGDGALRFNKSFHPRRSKVVAVFFGILMCNEPFMSRLNADSNGEECHTKVVTPRVRTSVENVVGSLRVC